MSSQNTTEEIDRESNEIGEAKHIETAPIMTPIPGLSKFIRKEPSSEANPMIMKCEEKNETDSEDSEKEEENEIKMVGKMDRSEIVAISIQKPGLKEAPMNNENEHFENGQELKKSNEKEDETENQIVIVENAESEIKEIKPKVEIDDNQREQKLEILPKTANKKKVNVIRKPNSEPRDSLLIRFQKRSEKVDSYALLNIPKKEGEIDQEMQKDMEESELRKWEDPKGRVHTFLKRFVKPSPKIYKKKKVGKNKYEIIAENNSDIETRSYMAKSRRFHHHFNPYQTVDFEENEEEEEMEISNPTFWSKRGMIRSASTNIRSSKRNNQNRLNLLSQIEKINGRKGNLKRKNYKGRQLKERIKMNQSLGGATLKRQRKASVNVGAPMGRKLKFKRRNRMFQSQVVGNVQPQRPRSAMNKRPRAVNVGAGFKNPRRLKHLVSSPMRLKHKNSWGQKGLLTDFLKNENGEKESNRDQREFERDSARSHTSARMETLTVELDENRSVCLDDMESKLSLFFKKTLVYASKIELLKMKSHKMSGENMTYSIFRKFCNPDNGQLSVENFHELINFLQYPTSRIAIDKIMIFLKRFKEGAKTNWNRQEDQEMANSRNRRRVETFPRSNQQNFRNEFKNSRFSDEDNQLNQGMEISNGNLVYEEFRELFTSHKIMTPEIFLFSNWTPTENLELAIPDPEFYLFRQIVMLTSRQLIDTSRIIRTLRAYTAQSVFDYLKMFNSDKKFEGDLRPQFEPILNPKSERIRKKSQTQALPDKFQMTNHSFGNNLVKSFRLNNSQRLNDFEMEESNPKYQTLKLGHSMDISPFLASNQISVVNLKKSRKLEKQLVHETVESDFTARLTRPGSILRSYIRKIKRPSENNLEMESMEFHQPDNQNDILNLESSPRIEDQTSSFVEGPKEIANFIDVDTVRQFLNFHNVIFLNEDLEVLMNCLGASSGILEFNLFSRLFYSRMWDF